MSSAIKAWKSSCLGLTGWLALLPWLAPTLLALLPACATVASTHPAPTPTGPLLPKEQAIEMGRSICGSGRITSASEPALDVAELTTNQTIAERLGRSPWAGLPADSPVWLVKFTGAFTIAASAAGRSPGQGGAPTPALGPFPSCWAIIEARTGARGTVYIPEK